jgi:peptide chain release factor 2
MVNDTRTGEKVSNADGVLDGDLDPFINAYLKWLATGGKPVGDVEED